MAEFPFCRRGAKITETMAAGSAYVTDATGKKVKVVHPNLFINKVSSTTGSTIKQVQAVHQAVQSCTHSRSVLRVFSSTSFLMRVTVRLHSVCPSQGPPSPRDKLVFSLVLQFSLSVLCGRTPPHGTRWRRPFSPISTRQDMLYCLGSSDI